MDLAALLRLSTYWPSKATREFGTNKLIRSWWMNIVYKAALVSPAIACEYPLSQCDAAIKASQNVTVPIDPATIYIERR